VWVFRKFKETTFDEWINGDMRGVQDLFSIKLIVKAVNNT